MTEAILAVTPSETIKYGSFLFLRAYAVLLYTKLSERSLSTMRNVQIHNSEDSSTEHLVS